MRKSIIRILSSILNNSGKMSPNVVAGLSVGVFASVIGYGVYSSYNNSPAYNPAKRAIYTGETQNLSLNSFEGTNFELGNSGTLPVGKGTGLYSSDGTFTDSKYAQSQADSEEAKFRAARSYFDSQKSGKVVVGTNGSGSGSGIGGEYQPFNSTYDVSESPATFAEKGAAEYGDKQFQGIQQQASAAVTVGEKGVASSGKGAKGAGNTRNSVSTSRPVTQVNKLASSNGSGSSFSGGSLGGGSFAGGGSGSNYGGSSKSVNEGQTRALPKNNNNVAKVSDGKAFQLGRGGTIGGFQAGFGGEGGEGNEKGGGAGGNTKDQLNTAYSFSTKGAATVQAGGDKSLAQGSAEAAHAFDGGASVESGATIGDGPAMDLGAHDLGLKLGTGTLGLDKLKTDFEDYAETKSSLMWSAIKHILYAFIASLTAVLAITAIINSIGNAGPWGKAAAYAGAVVIALAASYAIWGADYDGGKNIYETLSAWDDMRHNDGQGKLGWLFYTIMGVFQGCVIASIFLKEKAAKAVSTAFGKFTPQVLTAGAQKTVTSLTGDVTNKVMSNDK